MSRLWGLLAIGLCLGMLAGCDDDPPEPTCEVDNPCDEEGATRCNADEDGLETCTADDEGCLEWVAGDSCGEHQECDTDSNECVCVAEDDCDPGTSWCDGDTVVECLEDEDGCVYEDEDEDCATAGGECVEDGDEASCDGGCEDECTAGEEQCVTDTEEIEVCEVGDDGCTDWVITDDCADDGQFCDDTGGVVTCEDECTDQCEADETQCNGTVIETCELQTDNCLDWTAGTDCDDTGEVCNDDEEPAVCETTCTDECTDGELQCDPDTDWVQTCELQDTGCYDWSDTTDCADTGEVCDDTLDPVGCSPICIDDCDTVGANQCSDTTEELWVCEVDDTTGCNVWNVAEDCATTADYCDDAADECASCTHGCDTEGATQCSDTTEEIWTCTADDDGCRDWVPGTDCATSSQICDDLGADTVCVTQGDGACATPYLVTERHFEVSGDDFTADFVHSQQLDDDSCVTRDGDQVDAIFQIPLADGETVRVRQLGSLDAVLSIMVDACADDAVCEESSDSGETTGQEYTATGEQTVSLIVEAWYSSPSDVEYDIRIDILEEEVCGNGIDDDADGDTDCADDDCGAFDECEEFLNCDDGIDNDLDGDTDCDDSECYGVGTCPTVPGSCSEPIVVDSFPYQLAGDDITAEYSDDHDYTDDSCNSREDTVEVVFSVDLILGDRLVITELGSLDSVISVQNTCGGDELCVFSEDLGEDSGESYTAFADETVFVVVEAYFSDPSDVAYDINMVLETGEICDNTTDDDGDGDADCADSDCAVFAACDESVNCDDGEDNDADGDTDCADSDCADFAACDESLNCEDTIDNDVDGETDCDDSDCWGVGTCLDGTCAEAIELEPVAQVVTGDTSVGEDNIGQSSPEIWYTFTLTEDTTVDILMESTSFDTYLHLVDGDCTTPNVLASNDDCTGTRDSCLTESLTAGTYYIVVEGYSSSAYGEYTLTLDFMEPASLKINEVGYDQDGTDTTEFVELYLGDGTMDLTGYSLVHYNQNGTLQWEADLTGFSTRIDGFFVVGTEAMVSTDATWNADFGVGGGSEENIIQNGDSDALVLYFDYGGAGEMVMDAVAWEGPLDVDLPVSAHEGEPSTGIEFESWGNSIGRYPDGADTDSNVDDFPAGYWPTPGMPNTPAQPEGYTRLTFSTQGATALPASIPDDGPSGVTIQSNGPDWLPDTITDVLVGVNISHTWIGDLTVELTSPSHTTVTLHDGTGGSTDDLMTVYDTETTTAIGSMDDFDGENPEGEFWELFASDGGGGDTGQVNEVVLWIL